MKAMIFAAGLGTRLRPLTNDRPKALVEINGRTLLEITLERLRQFGVGEVVINVHHFAEMIVEYLRTNRNFGMSIEISREHVLLDTGGGLKNAAHFFLGASGASGETFLVHNVDVLSAIDLDRMVKFHRENKALATLAVQDRKTSRPLLFDDHLDLRGRGSASDQADVSPATNPNRALAFCGIQVVSPRVLTMMTEVGIFSIVDSYVRLAAQGEKILAFRADEYYWRDLGTPANVAQAARDLLKV